MTTSRPAWATWAVGALLIAVVAWLAYQQIATRLQANTAQQQATSLAEQVAQACARGGPLAAQLGAACEQASRVQQSIPGPQGTQGEPGEPGPKGDTGARGQPGDTGPTGPTGPPGPPGPAGPQGPAGPVGPGGTDGADGQDGKDGTDGPPGPPGPVCPDGYEPRPAVITAPDGSTYRGVACVDPDSSQPPTTSNPPLLGGRK